MPKKSSQLHSKLALIILCLFFNLNTINAQEKISMDEDWKFHFGNSSNPDKDFGFGSTLIMHKSNVFESTIVSPKFIDTTWSKINIPHDWVVELPFVKSETHEMDSHGYKPVGNIYPETSIGWYRKHFMVDKSKSDKRFEIQLDGIPSDGLVRDALGPQLPGWLVRMGAEVIAMNYVADELSLVVDAIALARTRADVIVTTGGTADGPRDHLHAALEQLGGELIVDRVKVRPGHPMLLANLDGVALLGLPGNPQSAIVGLMSLGQPVIDALLGRGLRELENVITIKEIKAREDFTRLVLGTISEGRFNEGEHLGSAMLRGLAHATGFAVAPSGVSAAGSRVQWLPLA